MNTIPDANDYTEDGATEPETDCDVHEPPCIGCRPLWDDKPDGDQALAHIEAKEE